VYRGKGEKSVNGSNTDDQKGDERKKRLTLNNFGERQILIEEQR